MSNIGDIERTCGGLEKYLNVAGYIPVVSSVTGPLRLVAGKIQVLVFSVLWLAALATGHTNTANRHFSCVLNGFGNIIRGAIESILFLGNILCFFYDNVLQVRCKYTAESFDTFSLGTRLLSNIESWFPAQECSY